MTTHLEVENLSDDNEKSLFRSQRLKLNGKDAITPFRVLNPARFRSDAKLNPIASGFNEFYHELTPERIAVMRKDSSVAEEFEREFNNLFGRQKNTDLAASFVKFKSDKSPFPNLEQIETLTDIAYVYSDITPIPIIDAQIGQDNLADYLKYLKDSLKTINDLNHKPIMGAIPIRFPRESIPALLDFYLSNDVTAFYIDFNGQTPRELALRPILRHLKNKKTLDQTFVYGINAKPGHALKNTNIIPSKDFIAFGYGLDVLGESHVILKRPREFYEKLKLAVNNQQTNKRRIFIRSDYGYYKASAEKEVEEFYPCDTQIPIANIFSGQQTIWQKLFNMEQQAVEAAKIRKRLNELDSHETILDYISQKSQIKSELKSLNNALKGISK